MKKGDLSISTIILIVLGVLVLVIILASIFRSSDSFTTATSCSAAGGRCADECDLPWSTGDTISDADSACGEGRVCCKIGV